MAQNVKLELYIGSFVLAGVIVIMGMILTMTGATGILSDTYKVIVRIEHIGGLKEGAPVKRGGFPIGKVADIRMDQRMLVVECDIALDVDLPVGTEARITNAGLVGDTFIEFTTPPGAERDYLPKTRNVGEETARIEGAGPVDMNRILKKVEQIGTEVTGIVRNLNRIVDDEELQRNVKESVRNVNATAEEAKHLLVSVRRSADKIYLAVENVHATTEKVKTMVDTAKVAVDRTVGDAKNIEAFNQTVANARTVSEDARGLVRTAKDLVTRADGLLERHEAKIDTIMANAAEASDNVKTVSAKARDTAGAVDPEKIRLALDSLVEGIRDAAALARKVREDLPTALSINKAADRIVNEKFREMDRRGIDTPDAALQEIRHWWRWNMEQYGYLPDPKYPDPSERPFVPHVEEHRLELEAEQH